MKTIKILKLALAALLLGTLAACGGGGGEGTLRLSLTDAPGDFDAVYVTIEKVMVHQSATAAETDGGWIEVPLAGDPTKRNLLELTNGVLAELAQTSLPAGHYSQLRLVLADNAVTAMANSVVPTGGVEVELKTPSGQQTGLKLNVDITVDPGKVADFLLDFDAAKSVVRAGNSGQYLLKPVIRVNPLVTTAPTGVAGFVDKAVAGATVSLFGSDGTIVSSASPDTNGWFKMIVPTGSYVLVVQAPDHTLAAVTGVPVTEGFITEVTAAPIVLADSANGTLDGVVQWQPAGSNPTPAVEPGSGATVTVMQYLAAGPSVEIASGTVADADGSYSYTAPVGVPQIAAYVALPAALVFADDAAGGMYSLIAHYDGFTDQRLDLLVALTAGATITTPFVFGP